MNPELQRYYEERLSMCSSVAWAQLMEDVETMLAATNTLDGATKDNIDFKKGECSLMRWLLSLKETSEQVYQQLRDEDATS